MCPGLTSPGAKLDQEIDNEKTVVIYNLERFYTF